MEEKHVCSKRRRKVKAILCLTQCSQPGSVFQLFTVSTVVFTCEVHLNFYIVRMETIWAARFSAWIESSV
jgi:hypothetical protein